MDSLFRRPRRPLTRAKCACGEGALRVPDAAPKGRPNAGRAAPFARWKALERAKAAEAASLAKGRFIAHISHELRTPLTTILGYSEMLFEDAEASGLRGVAADVGKIHQAGMHLLDLVNQVLDLSKIEESKVELFPEEFDMNELLDEALAALLPAAAKNGDALTGDRPPEPFMVRTDKTRVRQIIYNLLSNAVKFTRDGPVRLVLAPDELSGERAARIRVEDRGIGISAEQLTHLFQPYSQATSLISRRYGGTGLGLVLTKRYVEILGGTIDVESELGVGTTFTVRLPIALSTRS